MYQSKYAMPTATLVLGILCMILSVVLPADFMESTLGSLRMGGLLLIYICPVLGLIGIGFSVRHQQFLLGLGNLCIMFGFYIMMFVANLCNLS